MQQVSHDARPAVRRRSEHGGIPQPPRAHVHTRMPLLDQRLHRIQVAGLASHVQRCLAGMVHLVHPGAAQDEQPNRVHRAERRGQVQRGVARRPGHVWLTACVQQQRQHVLRHPRLDAQQQWVVVATRGHRAAMLQQQARQLPVLMLARDSYGGVGAGSCDCLAIGGTGVAR